MVISIIIPVFNKDQTIKRAAESVLRQGLTPIEYELLLIDDGSTDKSAEICRQLTDEHPDVIKYFQKDNEGVGPTRNFGIHHSSGQYICFLDADDYLRDGGFRDFLDSYFDEQFDVLSYYSTTIKEGCEDLSDTKDIHGEIMFETKGHNLLKEGKCPTFVWNSWYRKDFLLKNNVFFEPISYSEDLLFNINLLYANPKWRQTSSFIYVYVTYEQGNQLSKIRDTKKTTQNVSNFLKIFNCMSEVSKQMQKSQLPCDMETIFENSLPTFTSRLLSSGISVKQLRKIKKKIDDTGLNKRPSNNYSIKMSRIILNSEYIFPLLKFLYQKVFLKYILPRIDRETGSMSI